MIMFKPIAALVGFIILTGCDANKAPDDVSRSEPNTTLPDTPDFAPRPDVIPTSAYLDHTGPKFLLRMNTDGEIFRNDKLTSRSAIVDELLAIPDIADVAVIIEVNSDMLVRHVLELQSYLSDSVPGLRASPFISVQEPGGE